MRGEGFVQPVESINHFLICGMQSVAEWNVSLAWRVVLSGPHGELGYFFMLLLLLLLLSLLLLLVFS